MNKDKRPYANPIIESIKLDYEISLALASEPFPDPTDTGWVTDIDPLAQLGNSLNE